MLLEIPEVLNQAQLQKVKEILETVDFVDGKATAGMAASRVKNNQEMRQEPQKMELLNRIIMSSLAQHPVFRNAALPLRVADFIVARYRPGMTYGDHVDDPIMGAQNPRFRTDVSLTLFLHSPDDYEGGELVIRTSFGSQKVKLPAGHSVLYPSSSIHHVAEVIKGERLVALTWMQSYVRDPAKRELLYDLSQAREQLLKQSPELPITAQIDRSYVNLLRMWSEL